MRELLVALAAYITLCSKKSLCFSMSDVDGHAWFLEYARKLDGNVVIYRDGFGQYLDFESKGRTLCSRTKKSRTRQKSLGLR